MRMPAAIVMLVLLAGDAVGQEAEGQRASQPADLPRVFADEFQEDNRKQYEIQGQVDWQPGLLTLAPGASISKVLDAGSEASVDFTFKMPEAATDGDSSEARLRLRLEGATDCLVIWARTRQDGKTTATVRVADTVPQESAPAAEATVRQWSFEAPDFSRPWRIEYRYGLITISHGLDQQADPQLPGDEPNGAESRDEPRGTDEFVAYIENGSAAMRALSLAAGEQPLTLGRLEAQAAGGAVLNPEQQERLAEAQRLNSQGFQLWQSGRAKDALPLAQREADLRRDVLGEDDPDHATSVNNLASLYQSMGDYAKAEPLIIQARDIRRKALGEDHPDYADSLNSLASLYQSMGDYAKAEPLFVQARDICRKALGEDHPVYATSLNNLALLYQSMGEYAKAEPLIIQARDICRKALGEDHPVYARSLDNLAWLYESMGEYAQAEPFAREAMEIELRHVGRTLPWLAEAQALSLLSRQVGANAWLSVARELPASPHLQVWSAVWRTRGLLCRRASEQRVLLRASPETEPILRRLSDVQRQLAQLTLAVPTLEQRQARQERLRELNDEKEQLERHLAAASAEFRRTRELDEVEPADLLAILPEETALVEVAKVTVDRPPAKGKGELQTELHYEAFVARNGTPARRASEGPGRGQSPPSRAPAGTDPAVTWVHLGPSAPIDRAVAQWRRMILESKPDEPEASPPQVLRQLVWDKLEPHLAGCRHVVLILDGDLTVLPSAALPGQSPGSYLIEDYALSTISHGRELYAQLTHQGERAEPAEELLIVGGVDYDHRQAAPSPPEPRGDPLLAQRSRGPAMADERPRWAYLDGTNNEAEALSALWAEGPVTSLGKTDANEDALRRHLPGARYVHLATHGFFANAKFRSMFGHDVGGERLFAGGSELVGFRRATVTARNPLLLSGIVLAGANLLPVTDELGLSTGEDGILTAEEVVSLDLRGTELVTLSACETGLGEIGAGGEGVFGLQRAFHLAGARTVVASLWKVDDAATQALMREFYRNLWEKKLGKLESLRQAQLTMIRHYDPKAGKLRGPGEQVVAAEGAKARNVEHRLPPFYWAAFVLSGDWR